MENNQNYFSVEQADKNDQKIFVWGNVMSLLLFLSLGFLNVIDLKCAFTFKQLFIVWVSCSCTAGALVGIFDHMHNLTLLTKKEVTISLIIIVATLGMMFTFPFLIKDIEIKNIFLSILVALPAGASVYSLTRFCIRIFLD